MKEPLVDVLLRWWDDTVTIRDADRGDVELARVEALEVVDRRLAARTARIDQREAEHRDLLAVGLALRRALGLEDADGGGASRS
jgi:hypothetical protein